MTIHEDVEPRIDDDGNRVFRFDAACDCPNCMRHKSLHDSDKLYAIAKNVRLLRQRERELLSAKSINEIRKAAKSVGYLEGGLKVALDFWEPALKPKEH